MGLRYRKSIKLGKGVRLNLSKSRPSVSVGTKGLRYTVGTKKSTATVGIPGTGIYYTTSKSHGSKRGSTNKKASPSKANLSGTVVTLPSGEKIELTDAYVRGYEKFVDDITGLHKKCSDKISWEDILNSPEPFETGEIGPKEKQAQYEFDTMQPTFFEKINKSAFDKRLEEAHERIAAAKEEDFRDYEEWENERFLAGKIINGDVECFNQAIAYCNGFDDFKDHFETIDFSSDDASYIQADVTININESIPEDKIYYNTSGKPAYKKMSATEMYDLAKNYVYSLTIRIARETYAILPVSQIVVNVRDNKDNGMGDELILSVCFETDQFEVIEFEKLYNPEEYIEKLVHNVNFKKTKGFESVEPLLIEKAKPSFAQKAMNKVKNVLPNGKFDASKWEEDNAELVNKCKSAYSTYLEKYVNAVGVDEKIESLKELISFFSALKEEFDKRGGDYKLYFEETFMKENSRKINPLKDWMRELKDLEDSYFDLKEKELESIDTDEMCKNRILAAIRENPGISQKELAERFDKMPIQKILSMTWELIQDGSVTKEKRDTETVFFGKG